MSCGLIDEAGEASDDEEFDRLVRAAANATEKAAAEYERAVDIVSRTAWGMRPDMAEHVDSIRTGVRALNEQAMHLMLLVADDETADGVGERPPTTPTWSGRGRTPCVLSSRTAPTPSRRRRGSWPNRHVSSSTGPTGSPVGTQTRRA